MKSLLNNQTQNPKAQSGATALAVQSEVIKSKKYE